MPIFPNFCLGNIGQKNVFYDILERRNAFLGQKNNKFEKSKNWHFSKQINPWFWSKNDHFSTFFFRQYSIGKCSLRYSTTRKRLSRLKKKEVQKSPKIDIFSKGLIHGFGLKMAIFPIFFLFNIGRENVFYDILEPKNAFQGYKNKKFKKSKNWHFFFGIC